MTSRLRTGLLPYVHRPAADAVRTGEPLARPMALDHPGRPDAHAPASSKVRSLDLGEPREPASSPRRGSL
ncbi:hypothetical protein [Streptomyces sp. NPDC002172]